MNDIYLEHIPLRYEAFCKEYPKLSLCRVILQEKGQYQISGTVGTHQARVSGKFQYDAYSVSDYPAVGDYVMADINGTGTAIIHMVLPRKSVFLRKAAGSGNTEQVVTANVDTVFLCMALNNDFMRNRFPVRRLGLILAGAATLPDLFDPILLQYRMICRSFKLEDVGTVLVSGVKEKGDVSHGDGLKRAYELGQKLQLCS
jgi:hypothetical protein